LALAGQGCHVVVAAKSATPQPTLPGTIYTVASEIAALDTGARALPVVLDLRDERACVACVERTIDAFGRVDILINNASALWWHTMEETPVKKFDLMHSVNARGAFIVTKLCLPHMRKNKWGRVISMSPPLPTTYAQYKGKTAYYVSKCGMSMVALGAASEGGGFVRANALWPATVVESLASENFQLGARKNWRKPRILSDCVLLLCRDEDETNGRTLIDDEYLKQQAGVVFPEDFVKYRCDANFEPPRLLADEASGRRAGSRNESGDWDVRRGDVRALEKDKARSKL
jgi:NAD(P)-dependent dehydrogenase (short-subunit alcohol dehydrogenase family)